MALPEELQQALLKEAESQSLRKLANAREGLTQRYKFREGSGKRDEFIRTEEDRLTYVLSRMPATFAAVTYCLERSNFLESCQSVLDAGSGPGTASWAAKALGCEGPFTLLERDRGLIELGKKLALEGLNNAKWIPADLTALPDIEEHDLVICSYALGEIPVDERAKLIDWLWGKSKKALLIVEPGSKEGFGVIREVRASLLQKGAFLAGPCPHALECPMPKEDWCHFSVRLERSNVHRLLKSGSLSYEDEKFSYVLTARLPVAYEGKSRIVGYPEKHSGHLSLKLCTSEGTLVKEIISRKDGEKYKLAKKAVWGDTF